MMGQHIEALLYSYLLKRKHKANKFSKEEQSHIIKICAQYLTAGFILESSSLHPDNINLIHGLKEQRKVTSMRLISMKQDLISIAKTFNSKNIDFITLKGMALIMEGIYKAALYEFALGEKPLEFQQEDLRTAYQRKAAAY